jgi:hypothetical protein
MKSVIWFLFSMWFTLLSAGVNINAHWCGSQVADIALFGKKAKACKCSSKKAKKDKSCCSNSSAYFKITDQYTATPTAEIPPVNSSVSFNHSYLPEVSSSVTSSKVLELYSWIPPPERISIYLRLQQFRT